MLMSESADLLVTWNIPLHLDNVESIVLYRKKHGFSCEDVFENGELIFETNNVAENEYLDTVDTFGVYRYAVFAKNGGGYSPCSTDVYTIGLSILWFEGCDGNYTQMEDYKYSFQPAYQIWEQIGEDYVLTDDPKAMLNEYSKFLELDPDDNIRPTLFPNEVIEEFEIEGKERYEITCPVTVDVVTNILSGTTTGSGTHDYQTSIEITCSAGDGHTFIEWVTNAGIIQDPYSPSTTIRLLKSGYVMAIFEEQYAVTVDGENGTETGAGDYQPGDTVTLTATPDSGYEFDSWTVNSGNVTIDENNSFIMPTEDVSITANYSAIIQTLTAGYDTSDQIILRTGDPVGTIFYATDNERLYVYDGSAWQFYDKS